MMLNCVCMFQMQRQMHSNSGWTPKRNPLKAEIMSGRFTILVSTLDMYILQQMNKKTCYAPVIIFCKYFYYVVLFYCYYIIIYL